MKYYYIKALSYDMELCESIVQAQNRTIAQNKIVFLRNEKIKELYVREFEPYQTSLEHIEKQLYLFEKTIENCLGEQDSSVPSKYPNIMELRYWIHIS